MVYTAATKDPAKANILYNGKANLERAGSVKLTAVS